MKSEGLAYHIAIDVLNIGICVVGSDGCHPKVSHTLPNANGYYQTGIPASLRLTKDQLKEVHS
jgi:hypothetical protein